MKLAQLPQLWIYQTEHNANVQIQATDKPLVHSHSLASLVLLDRLLTHLTQQDVFAQLVKDSMPLENHVSAMMRETFHSQTGATHLLELAIHVPPELPETHLIQLDVYAQQVKDMMLPEDHVFVTTRQTSPNPTEATHSSELATHVLRELQEVQLIPLHAHAQLVKDTTQLEDHVFATMRETSLNPMLATHSWELVTHAQLVLPGIHQM